MIESAGRADTHPEDFASLLEQYIPDNLARIKAEQVAGFSSEVENALQKARSLHKAHLFNESLTVLNGLSLGGDIDPNMAFEALHLKAILRLGAFRKNQFPDFELANLAYADYERAKRLRTVFDREKPYVDFALLIGQAKFGHSTLIDDEDPALAARLLLQTHDDLSRYNRVRPRDGRYNVLNLDAKVLSRFVRKLVSDDKRSEWVDKWRVASELSYEAVINQGNSGTGYMYAASNLGCALLQSYRVHKAEPGGTEYLKRAEALLRKATETALSLDGELRPKTVSFLTSVLGEIVLLETDERRPRIENQIAALNQLLL